MNPFEVLEIAPDASPEEIKAAYHRLAKQWHPDRFTGAEKESAENHFRQLADAFNALKDPAKRAEAAKFTHPSPGESRPLSERSPEDWLKEAKTALEDKDYERAIGLLQFVLKLDPNRAEAHRLVADVMVATGGDRRTLVKALENTIRLKPRDVEAMLRLADTYQSLGMEAKAQRLRSEAHVIAPNHKAFKSQASGKAASSEPRSLMGQFQDLIERFRKKG